MKFEVFKNELHGFIKENNLQDIKDLPTLAFYQFLNESGMGENLNLYLKTTSQGRIDIVQKKSNDRLNVFNLEFDEISEYLRLKVHDSYSNNIPLFTDTSKKFMMSVYNVVLESNNLDELRKGFNNLVNIDSSYTISNLYESKNGTVQQLAYLVKSLNDTEAVGGLYKREIKASIENLLGLSEHVASRLDYDSVNILVEFIMDDTKKVPDKIITEFEGDNFYENKNSVYNYPHRIRNFNLDNSLLGTIIKNEKNKDNILNAIYTDYVMDGLKNKIGLHKRMLGPVKTIQQKLESVHIKKFMNQLAIKYPAAFAVNEMDSLTINLYDKNHFSKDIAYLTDVFDKFKVPSQVLDFSGSYTDFNNMQHSNAMEVFDGDNFLRFIGETEQSIKYVISAKEKRLNNGLLGLDIYHLNMLKNNNDTYSRIGYEQLFTYCKKNEMFILMNEKTKYDMGKHYDLFKEVAKDYQDLVFLSEKYNSAVHQLLESTKLDMQSLIKHKNTLLTIPQDTQYEATLREKEELINRGLSKNKKTVS